MFSTGQIEERIVGTLLFPATNYLLNRRNILQYHRRMCRTENYPAERLRELQLIRLREVIAYAGMWIPYYAKKFKEVGLESGDLKDFEDIANIPITSRQDVVDYHGDMVDIRLKSSLRVAEASARGPGVPLPFARIRRHRLVRNTSSGSTGIPTVFYDDGIRAAISWAYEFWLKKSFGIGRGAREARMARISNEYFQNTGQILLRKWAWNQLILPGLNMSDDDYALCLGKIERFRPKVLWGFTSALCGLAEYILKNGHDIPSSIRLAIAWAAPLYEHEKRAIRQAFDCPVTNIYGAREVGHVAALCPQGSFHINQSYLYVESEKCSGMGASGPGEILVTTLDHSPMPFIRYRMGDLAEVVESRCACGRTFQVLSNFSGRTGQVFFTRDGRMISPNFWCRTFMDADLAGAIKQFQVVYSKNGDIRIRIVKASNYSAETEANLKKHLGRNFQADVRIDFDFVPHIQAEVSGKYNMVIWQESERCNLPSQV
jgi:phenylacetate-CoA ligase